MVNFAPNETQDQCLGLPLPYRTKFCQDGHFGVVEKSFRYHAQFFARIAPRKARVGQFYFAIKNCLPTTTPKVRTNLRTYGDLITRISGINRLPNSLCNGAALARARKLHYNTDTSMMRSPTLQLRIDSFHCDVIKLYSQNSEVLRIVTDTS